MPDTPDPLLLVDDAASAAHVSDSTIRRHYRLPESHPHHLKAIKHFGQIKIRRSWLDDWIDRTADDAA